MSDERSERLLRDKRPYEEGEKCGGGRREESWEKQEGSIHLIVTACIYSLVIFSCTFINSFIIGWFCTSETFYTSAARSKNNYENLVVSKK
jgi:hypothetical protein